MNCHSFCFVRRFTQIDADSNKEIGVNLRESADQSFLHSPGRYNLLPLMEERLAALAAKFQQLTAVSYTHLTLPTSDLV